MPPAGPPRDASQEAIRAVERITNSGKVRGEDLLSWLLRRAKWLSKHRLRDENG